MCSLADPRITELRAEALGENAPWAPTLLAVDGDRVRAWTGPRLSWRMARLLGLRRSAHVARSLSRAEAVVSPDRRHLIEAVPGVAVAAFLVSGGTASAAVAKALPGRSRGKITALQAMQRHLGITTSDLVTRPAANPALTARSQSDPRVRALLGQARSDGFKTGEATTYTVDVPLNRTGKANPQVNLVRHELRKGHSQAGYAYHASGSRGDLLIAVVRRGDGSLGTYFDQKGSIEHVVFDHRGQLVSGTTAVAPVMVPDAVTCQAVCNLVCGQGAAGTVSECVAACLAGGPEDEPICAPLCGILVGLGCLLGCSDVCCICCGEC